MNRRVWAALLPQLEALHRAIRGVIAEPRGRYFDPRVYSQWFGRFEVIADELRKLEPDLLGTLPVPDATSSGTSDFDGRGYYELWQLERLSENVDLAVSIIRHNAPATDEPGGAFFSAGQHYDAYKALRDIVQGAKREVTIEDPYVDASTIEMIEPIAGRIVVRVLTSRMQGDFELAARKFAKQYGNFEVRTTTAFHDRFVVVDGTPYLVGASLKDAGNRGFMFTKIEGPTLRKGVEDALAQAWTAGAKVV